MLTWLPATPKEFLQNLYVVNVLNFGRSSGHVLSGYFFCSVQLSRDQNPLVGNPLASGNKDLAVSKRVGFVSYRKQNRSACCAVSRRKRLFGALHVATISAVSACQEKRAP